MDNKNDHPNTTMNACAHKPTYMQMSQTRTTNQLGLRIKLFITQCFYARRQT